MCMSAEYVRNWELIRENPILKQLKEWVIVGRIRLFRSNVGTVIL